MSSSSSMSSFETISNGSISDVESVVDQLDALSFGSVSRSASVIDLIEEPKEKEILEKLEAVSKTTSNIDEKLEKMSAMMAMMAEEIKELKKEKKEEEAKKMEEMKEPIIGLSKIPITKAINGEWKQVKSTNLDEFIASLKLKDEAELKWRAGNLCFSVVGPVFYSTHRIHGVPNFKTARTKLNNNYKEAPDFDQTYVEGNKIITTNRSKKDARMLLRIERSVSNGVLTAVYETATVTCTRTFRRVGDFENE